MRRFPLVLLGFAVCACGAGASTVTRPRPIVDVRASPTGTVAGTARGLTDEGFAPLRATVVLRSVDGRIEFQARSDDSGEFFFGPVPAGPYRLIVSAPGWRVAARDLRVAAGEALYPDVALDRDAGGGSAPEPAVTP